MQDIAVLIPLLHQSYDFMIHAVAKYVQTAIYIDGLTRSFHCTSCMCM